MSSQPDGGEAPRQPGILRWMRRAVPRGTGFESARNLSKWLAIGTAIGLVAGLGAVAFYLSIDWATEWLLGRLAGYAPPTPAGEGGSALAAPLRPWLLPLVAAAGGLVSGLIVYGLAPEAEGHGTDAAIEAIHRRGGRIRGRIPIVKLVASAITIGSGGSAGREGPAAQISAAFGSLLGRRILSDPSDRRIAVAAGIGAGIGAIFRAPLGGAVLAAEILYLHDIEVEAIIPALIASIVGYTVYGAWLGYGPIFGAHPGLELGPPIQLVYYAALGLLGGAGGVLYARTFYGVAGVFRRLRIPRWTKPALGGLLVGLIGMALPQVLHTGYGWVQMAMTRQGILELSLPLLVAIPLLKILATSLTIGSGGSGGVFGPGMVVGGMLGALLWRVGQGVLPHLPPSPAPFVIIGMMALFGGIAHAPLAVMLMVAEMTGTLSLLAPAMIAVAVSTALVGDETIYRAQLRGRAQSPVHRAKLSFPVLSALGVRDAARPAAAAMAPSSPAADVLGCLGDADQAAVVLGERGEPVGAVSREEILRLAPEERGRPVERLASRVVLRGEQSLDEAMEALAAAGAGAGAVVDGEGPPGVVTPRDVLRAYRSALRRGVSAVALPHDTALVQFRLEADSVAVGRTLEEMELPRDAVVVLIGREGSAVFPRPAVRLEVGDVVAVLASRLGREQVRALFRRRGGP